MGIGNFGSDAFNNKNKSGVMGDVAASANDPIFLNHHAMVDCIFETWLRMNPNSQYPVHDEIPRGHRQEDYIVPFFPLYKHSDMFSTADKFGYKCTIKSEQSNKPSNQPSNQPSSDTSVAIDGFVIAFGILGGIPSVCLILILCVGIIRYYKFEHKTYRQFSTSDATADDDAVRQSSLHGHKS